METIKIYNKIADEGLQVLNPFYEIKTDASNPKAILLRSQDLHQEQISDSVLAIARAGAGTNNIPIAQCTDKGIVVFNTPGANANAVKELAIAALFLASRNIVNAVDWVKKLSPPNIAEQVEKGKAQFSGPELYGKSLGVIGLGAIGVNVANAALDLGMDVWGYDPYLSVDAAWGLSRNVKKAEQLQHIFQNCDYITVHIPMSKATEGFLNAAAFEQMKNGVRLLNLSRGELVNDTDLIGAIEAGKVAAYVTDFPNETLVNIPQVIAIPHLGASTPESEINCAVMAAKFLKTYLENGNIHKSVNFPSVEMPPSSPFRITFCHQNIPNMIGQISGAMAAEGINIVNLINKSKDALAYTIMDIEQPVADAVIAKLNQIQGMIRVRCIYTK